MGPRPLAGTMPEISAWAAQQYRHPIITWTMRNHERPLNVNSYSLATEMVDEFSAVISDQLELSVVYPSVVRSLGLQPATLPPGLFGEHRMSPMGRFRPSRYAVLAIGGLGPGIPYKIMLLLVFDDNVPYCGVDFFFGTRVLDAFFGGQLPEPPPPHIPTSANISWQDFFAQGG